jgi:membrane associated rhomboid family serine protease
MKAKFKKSFKIALWATAAIWVVFILDFLVFFADFNAAGIRPRQIEGLIGIPLSPFLHGGFGHIISNSIPLFILTFFLVFFHEKIWIQVTLFSVFLGGFCVWLLAPGVVNNIAQVHIGASGVIFSYIAFLIFSGVFRRDLKSIGVAVIILLLYGFTLIFGIIPGQKGISWQGHLFGAIAGVLAAYIYRKKDKESNKPAVSS